MAAKFPDQSTLFVSSNRPNDLRMLSGLLVSMSGLFFALAGCSFNLLVRTDVARKYPHIPELNVLVVGMPNVGKSTLLNALRDVGIPGRTYHLALSFVVIKKYYTYIHSDAQGPPYFCPTRFNKSSLYTIEDVGGPACVLLRHARGDVTFSRTRRQRCRARREIGTDW